MTRVCLLTGAGGVFGEAFCRARQSEYAIIAVYRRQPPLVSSQTTWLFDPVAPRQTVSESAHPVFAVQADLRQPGEVERVVELALARLDRVDLLVNAAADVATSSLLTTPDRVEEWREQLEVNAVVPVHLAAAIAATFWRTRDRDNRAQNRNIVNLSSTAGLGPAPGVGRGFYGASKAALTVLTRQMAVEYARFGVRVNAVAPTYFPRVVATEQVVDAVVRLDADRQTGRTMVLDGDGERWA